MDALLVAVMHDQLACKVVSHHSQAAPCISWQDGRTGVWLCPAGFTPAEEVEEVDTSQEQPQGLAAFVSKLQGYSQNDPFYAVVSYKDFKPGSQTA